MSAEVMESSRSGKMKPLVLYSDVSKRSIFRSSVVAFFIFAFSLVFAFTGPISIWGSMIVLSVGIPLSVWILNLGFKSTTIRLLKSEGGLRIETSSLFGTRVNLLTPNVVKHVQIQRELHWHRDNSGHSHSERGKATSIDHFTLQVVDNNQTIWKVRTFESMEEAERIAAVLSRGLGRKAVEHAPDVVVR